MSDLNRRQFCVITGAGLALGACGSSVMNTPELDMAAPADMAMPVQQDLYNPSCPVNNKLNVGPAAAFTVGQAKLFDCAKVYVLRDVMGIYAMTAICTHNGCTVAFIGAAKDFQCPCHMSTYDLNGAVTAPPAMLPLQHFDCSFDGSGNVIVNLGAPVDPSTRLTMHD
jgi:Rieske Fe-S protein